MPKNDKSTKGTTAPPKGSGGGKSSARFSKDKERAHLARTAYNVVTKSADKAEIFKCPNCKECYVFKSAYTIHRKSCGIDTCVSCTEEDVSIPTYATLSEVRGDRYASANKRKAPWSPRFAVQKYLTVLVDEDSGKTEKRWITVKKYPNYQALLDDDGETIIDESGENVQYVDPAELNQEGDDQAIVD